MVVVVVLVVVVDPMTNFQGFELTDLEMQHLHMIVEAVVAETAVVVVVVGTDHIVVESVVAGLMVCHFGYHNLVDRMDCIRNSLFHGEAYAK